MYNGGNTIRIQQAGVFLQWQDQDRQTSRSIFPIDGYRVAGQMPMHKKELVRVYVPAANGPRMKYWRNWLGKWPRQVLFDTPNVP